MAHMVYQRYTTAVKRGYRDRPDASVQLARVTEFREWLERLEIDTAVRAELVEQARALEHGFEEVVARPSG
jgi:hypothetical protein